MICRTHDVVVRCISIGLGNILSEFLKRLEYKVCFLTKPGGYFLGIPTKCNCTCGDSMESLSVAWTPGSDRCSENACNICCMNMVDRFHSEIRNRDGLTVNQCFKHLRILIGLRIDGWMSGADNMSWMDDGPRKMGK